LVVAGFIPVSGRGQAPTLRKGKASKIPENEREIKIKQPQELKGGIMTRLKKPIGLLSIILVLLLALAGCAALTLTITSPAPGTTVTESVITVTGTVSNPKATVTVKGIEVATAGDGTFSTTVELAPGSNTIAVVAELGKERVVRAVSVRRE